MKKIFLLSACCFLFSTSVFSQGGTWTWISGDSALNAPAHGSLGSPSVNNHPPAMYESAQWKDKQGNFWVYGGTLPGANADLWSFNPSTLEWTWVKGNGQPNQPPVYGTKGVANSANTPGSRSYTTPTWVDTSGALWLFGGAGGWDDMWKYDIGSNKWTWVAGDTVTGFKSHHGTKGITNAANTPGNRYSTSSTWTDSVNNLWLFGGFGFDDNNNGGGFDDVWKFNTITKQWTWMSGSKNYDPLPVYGTKGTAAPGNELGGRFSYTNWQDVHGNFWVMGGIDYDQIHFGSKNDVWKYDINTHYWAWMSGDTLLGDTGVYHAACTYDALNKPSARAWQRSSVTDNCGRFWLFGGSSDPNNCNDLWVLDPQQVKWNLVKGTNPKGEQPEHFGTKGLPSVNNMPHSRFGAVSWWGNDNKFYLFGGEGNSQTSIYADMWVFTPDTACVPNCNAVVIPPPVAEFQSSKTSICGSDCVDFTNLSTQSTSWKWTFTGAGPATSTLQNPLHICYPVAGNYAVTLVAYNSAGKDSVTSVNYIHVSAPKTPVIEQNGAVLYFYKDTSYASYQWFDSTALIPNATDTFLIITHGGNYNLEVLNSVGCKTGAGTNVTLTGGKEFTVYPARAGFTVSPNPVADKLAVSGSFAKRTNPSSGGQLADAITTIEVYNLIGKKILSRLPTPNSQLPTVLDVSSLTPGIYFIRIESGGSNWIGRFVKE